MTKATLKQEIYKLVDRLEKKSDMEQLKALLEEKLKAKSNHWVDLSDEQVADVKEGMDQLRRGEGIPYSEIKAEVKKRYNL